MKIVVIGAGAMGTLFGGKLALAGAEVTMVDVVPEAVESMRRDGLVLELLDGVHRAPVEAYLAQDVPFIADLVVLFTKSLYSRAALESARRFMDSRTVVLSLQNGLGNLERISEFVPKKRIILGTTDFPSDLVSIGHIRSLGDGHTSIMTAEGGETPFLQQVCGLFDRAGLGCAITPDIMKTIWSKVAVNATANSITAVCRLRCGVLVDTPEAGELARHIVDEIVAVAAAEGTELDGAQLKANIFALMAEMRTHLTSTEQDVLAKRPTEIGSINGGVLQKARALGIPVPYNETMYLLIRTIEQNYDGQVLS